MGIGGGGRGGGLDERVRGGKREDERDRGGKREERGGVIVLSGECGRVVREGGKQRQKRKYKKREKAEILTRRMCVCNGVG